MLGRLALRSMATCNLQNLNVRKYIQLNHKARTVYIKSTTVYVPSSELELSQPLSQQVCPSPQNRGGGGGHTPRGVGGWGSPIFPTPGEKA